jgi:hypothetical protein
MKKTTASMYISHIFFFINTNRIFTILFIYCEIIINRISLDESHHLSVDEFFSAGENLFEMSIGTLTQTTCMQLFEIR